MTEDEEVSIGTELEAIGEMWEGNVHITYKPQWGKWVISNKTDEGLPVKGPEKRVESETLEKAVTKIKEGKYD